MALGSSLFSALTIFIGQSKTFTNDLLLPQYTDRFSLLCPAFRPISRVGPGSVPLTSWSVRIYVRLVENTIKWVANIRSKTAPGRLPYPSLHLRRPEPHLHAVV